MSAESIPIILPSTLTSTLPLDRYRMIIGAMSIERESWVDTFWLRIAAQAAMQCPDSPATLAQRIRESADALRHGASWYQSLASPARFVVAARLIQHRIPIHEFISEHSQLVEMLSAVGLHRHSGLNQIMTTIILRLSASGQPSVTRPIDRIKAIYEQMKRFHWWLTGPDDLPACAALAQCPGSPEEIVARVEIVYQALHKGGLLRGEHLQTAANLLPVIESNLDAGVWRYFSLKKALENRVGVLDEIHYETLVVLTMLAHPAERIVSQLLATYDELNRFQPDQHDAANFLIAADLTFLDLVRFQPEPESATVSALRPEAEIDASMATFHIVAAVLVSLIGPGLIWPPAGTTETNWPY